VVRANTFSGTAGYGIYELATSLAEVAGNHISNMYDAVYQEDSVGSTVSGNSGTGDAWGIYSSGVSGVSYSRNSFGYGQYGIETDYPASETLSGNVTSHNHSAGIYVYTGGSTTGYSATLTGNTGNDNQFGLYAQFPTLGSGNHATGNSVINCYNVTCSAAGARAAGARAAGPIHRVPRRPATPVRPRM
jgi:nitrous oxidase accessory protein NosD